MVKKDGTSLCTGVSEEALQSVINALKPGKLDTPYRIRINYSADQEETALSQTAQPPQHFSTHLGLTLISGYIIINDYSCFVEIKWLAQLEGKGMA